MAAAAAARMLQANPGVAMDANDESRRRAWSAYWSSGRLHSCAGSFQGNYAGAIGAFWRRLFGGLAPGSRVLDLATGNGPLPLLAWEARPGAVEVDAVDLADVAPAWFDPARHGGIRFHSRVRMEALPFATGTFDCVVSQFGFEYADRAAALAECLRVTRAGGGLALVMHHAGSVLARVGREELAHHARLRDGEGLLAAARGVAPWLARARGGQGVDADAANAARERYNRAMQDVAAAIAASPAPDLLLEVRDAVHGLLARVGPGGEAAALDALDAQAASLDAARLRTAEMVACALDEADAAALAGMLRQARPGIAVQYRELRQPEGVLAWSLLAGPPAEDGG